LTEGNESDLIEDDHVLFLKPVLEFAEGMGLLSFQQLVGQADSGVEAYTTVLLTQAATPRAVAMCVLPVPMLPTSATFSHRAVYPPQVRAIYIWALRPLITT
jgi:hypothetical protein